MTRRNLALMAPEPDDEPRLDSLDLAWQQEEEARRELDRPLADYLRWPYASLDDVMGLWAPGEMAIGCAFSGSGKTLFTTNVEYDLLRQGRRVYHIGLETRPALVRLHFACLHLGYYVGDVLSGAAKYRPDWPEMERALRAEINAGFREDFPLVVNNERWLDVAMLTKALEEAAFYGCHLVVIDHMDHLATSEHVSLYQASVATTRRLVEATQSLGLRVLALSQLNNDAVRGDVLTRHRPPRPEYVFMGGHKRQVATTMLGMFRPLDPDASAEDLKAVRAERLDVASVLQKNVMGVCVMKHRHYGNREGRVVKLGVDKGRLSDLAQESSAWRG